VPVNDHDFEAMVLFESPLARQTGRRLVIAQVGTGVVKTGRHGVDNQPVSEMQRLSLICCQ
jgi:hypothetical protein